MWGRRSSGLVAYPKSRSVRAVAQSLPVGFTGCSAAFGVSMKIDIKNLKNRVAVVTMGLLASATALAADPVADAATDATTKVGTYGALLVGVAAVGVGFSIGIKYVKKIARAA